MGDVGEYWADVKPGMIERSKQRRANNRDASAAILTAEGIPFDSKNNGAHLVIQIDVGRFNFWPGTGLWAQALNNSQYRGRGVRRLLNRIHKLRKASEDK